MSITVLIVPGLRDKAPAHWQTWLHDILKAEGQAVVSVPPMGREDLSLQARLEAIDEAIWTFEGPAFIVAHSGGCQMLAHWVGQSSLTHRVAGAFLVAPPNLNLPMPAGYPTLDAMRAGGWYPLPTRTLPFKTWVGISKNDPLSSVLIARQNANYWGAETIELGEVGHLNPQSGYGPWPEGLKLIRELAADLESTLKAH